MTSFNFLHIFNDCSNVYVFRRKFMSFKSLMPEGRIRRKNLKYTHVFSQTKSAFCYRHSTLYPITVLSFWNLIFLLSINFPSFSECVDFYIRIICARFWESQDNFWEIIRLFYNAGFYPASKFNDVIVNTQQSFCCFLLIFLTFSTIFFINSNMRWK